jgi:hypothetical protein
MKHKHIPKSNGNRWWNGECRQATDALRTASADGDEETIKTANANLKRVTRKAKREWAQQHHQQQQCLGGGQVEAWTQSLTDNSTKNVHL